MPREGVLISTHSEEIASDIAAAESRACVHEGVKCFIELRASELQIPLKEGTYPSLTK